MQPLFLPLLLLCLVLAASANELRDGVIRSVIESNSHVNVNPTQVTTLSWSPRIYLYTRFLSDEECDHLIDLAKDKLTKSMVFDNESGKSKESSHRTSSGMFLSRAHDETVKRIEEKIALWTFFPVENGEEMQVLKYEYGQKYEPHFDRLFPVMKHNRSEFGSRRVATVIMYLSDVIKGGETVFPSVDDKETFKNDSWTECGKEGLGVKPRKGNALLFYSTNPDNSIDRGSLHQGCPVIEGEKWSATKWIHEASFGRSSARGACIDKHERCGHWAAVKECENNPVYMVGTSRHPGYCRKSCNAC